MDGTSFNFGTGSVGLVFRYDDAATALESGLQLYRSEYPNPALAEILFRSPAAEAELFYALQLASITELPKHARVYSGGLLKIEPRELAQAKLRALVEGAQIVRSELSR